jgi:hypothetical protein
MVYRLRREKQQKYRMLCIEWKVAYKKGIEAFNLLNFLSSQLLPFSPGPVKHPQKLFIRGIAKKII